MTPGSASDVPGGSGVHDGNGPGGDGLVLVGRVRAAWGLRGDVSVEPLSDDPRRFDAGSVLLLRGRPVRVERARPHKRGLLVKFDAANDRDQALALRGEDLCVRPEDARQLPDGVYYHFQILGIAARTKDGQPLGAVSEIIVTGANDVYVVSAPGRRDILIPALPDVVMDVDLPAAVMTVDLPEGLA